MKRNRIFLYSVIGLAFTIFGFYAATKGDIYFEVAKNIDLFTKVYKEVTFNYVDDINPEEFLRSGIKGMLQNLDPYTVFIDEKRQEDIELLTTGKYGGIGISVGVRDEKITIVEIMDGYSAQRQGLQISDQIIAVDSIVFEKSNLDEVSFHVKGEPGTYVNLKIIRPGVTDTLLFNLLREEVIVKNISFADFIPGKDGMAYIKLTGFSRGAGEELRRSILNLQKSSEIKSFILDLRGNPGGLLESAVDISSVFLSKGVLVVSTQGRDSSSYRAYNSQKEPLLLTTPMAVLINEGSASASEIVAGALQDHDRAVIIGEKSFGKGLVQTVSPLTNNTSLKITTSKYFTPSGRCIQKIDYSKDNKVLNSLKVEAGSSFSTDNRRTVYAGGGITPDSSISNKEIDELTKDLLAKGYIFKIATALMTGSSGKNFDASDKSLIKEKAQKLLNAENYVFQSDFSKKVADLQKNLEKNNDFASVKSELDALSQKSGLLEKKRLSNLPESVIDEILAELKNRQQGTKAKILYNLQNDNQFELAVSLLNNSNSILQILKNK